ncbi:NADH-quinone oxidoreductase subunit NuoN [Rhodospirillaceae bacterium KN72]|uniref:NADH-quinone oxidoreductase subunit N n=1 Tax=Pacificispira spongiicola TaxID=2729598 RepID=A0A7Y0HHL8_9PROT|nr:NADH-quinone oxidoreductase subunit NuoN [Pacificispira spongiicola]NMM46027.1 NADH-quinone oxidoreductase subunit NuoN [Pacificispira spongiicola]
MMFETSMIAPALPEIVLACSVMGLMMVGVFSPEKQALSRVSFLAVLVLLVIGVLVIATGSETRLALHDLFVVDSFSLFMKVLVIIAAVLALVMSDGYIRRESMARFEYPVLLCFATLGMLMMISAHDLISLYIGLELQSLSLYVVAAFRRDQLRSTEAGLKYFVLGALSSGLLLYGSSLIYGFAGTTNFAAIASGLAALDHAPTGLIVGLVFLSAGLAFKISAVPFHMWTPDVYEGAPTPVTAFFAVAPKIAAMALILRVMLGPFEDLIAEWQQIIWLISVASMILGAVAAIAQTNIKRLMAYSSIGHVGYALMGLAAGTKDGATGVMLYMAIYLVMNVGTFACILSMKIKDRMVENISDLSGLSKTRPGMAFALMIFMFSMAGIPPLAGFFGKFFVFRAAIDAGLIWLAVIGALASVVSAFYYLRIIKVMYFDENDDVIDKIDGKSMRVIMILTSALVLLFTLAPETIASYAASAATSLF